MGERKVLNKYIPPDFDPALIPRGKKLSAKDGTVPVRMMLPFTAQCSSCNTFLYRGTKFNSKKEAMGGPDGKYLGITRWRFYIKCTSCARSLTFLTDPKNADYEMESGGTRNYEVYKDQQVTEEQAVQDQVEEEKLDPMKALENRVLDSRREMQELSDLEAIRAMNARHVQLALQSKTGEIVASSQREDGRTSIDNNQIAQSKETLSAEDESLIKSIHFRRGPSFQSKADSISMGSLHPLKRLDSDDEERIEEERKRKIRQFEEQQANIANRKDMPSKSSLPVAIIKRKRVGSSAIKSCLTAPSIDPKVPESKINGNSTIRRFEGDTLVSLLGDYGSDEESD